MANINFEGQITYDRSSKIGRGLFGTVYAGNIGTLSVAVKVTRTDESVQQEIQAIRETLEDPHENILYCYLVKSEGFETRFALQRCHSNLREWMATSEEYLHRDKITQLDITVQLTAGIKYLHEKRIIHQNLKPENILFEVKNSKATVKIAGYGKIISNLNRSFTMTHKNSAGIKGWLAPEVFHQLDNQYEKIQMRPSSDIFPLGCLLYYIQTSGVHPFGKTSMQQEANIRENNYTIDESREWGTGFQERLPVIQMMLDPDYKNRPRIHQIHDIYSEIKSNTVTHLHLFTQEVMERQNQSQNVRQRNADLNRVREGNSHVLPVDTDNGVEIIDATDKLLDSSVNANNKLKYVVSTITLGLIFVILIPYPLASIVLGIMKLRRENDATEIFDSAFLTVQFVGVCLSLHKLIWNPKQVVNLITPNSTQLKSYIFHTFAITYIFVMTLLKMHYSSAMCQESISVEILKTMDMDNSTSAEPIVNGFVVILGIGRWLLSFMFYCTWFLLFIRAFNLYTEIAPFPDTLGSAQGRKVFQHLLDTCSTINKDFKWIFVCIHCNAANTLAQTGLSVFNSMFNAKFGFCLTDLVILAVVPYIVGILIVKQNDKCIKHMDKNWEGLEKIDVGDVNKYRFDFVAKAKENPLGIGKGRLRISYGLVWKILSVSLVDILGAYGAGWKPKS